jgi:outer membrane protein OmpA-like peptidoglycan-associated protein
VRLASDVQGPGQEPANGFIVRAVVASILALLGLTPASARAQTFAVESFRPAKSSSAAFSQDMANVVPRGALEVGLVLDYAHAPLVLRDLHTNDILPGGRIISGRLTGNLVAAVGFADLVELGVRFPVVLHQDGNLALLRPGAALAATAPGDLSLGAKLALVGRPRVDGFKLAFAADVDLPTGSTDSFAGDGGLGFRPRLIAGLERGDFQVALNVGYVARSRRVVAAGDFTMDDQALAGLALSYALAPGALWALGEAEFTHVVGAPDGLRDTPGSAIAGARWALLGPWVLQAGAGVGLAAGPGTPDLRGIVSFAYAPDVRRRAQPAVTTATPAPAPPPPDADKDSIADHLDKCPKDAEDRDGFQDDDGCPDPDNDHDGVPDGADKCPNDAEDKDGFQDDDGCPDPDNDHDGVSDAADKCPTEAEVVNGFQDEDGCPDKALITLKGDELETLTPVLFKTDRARVRHAFRPGLDAIAAFLKAHPELGRCGVEGHTDAEGPEDWNAKLSLERADAVVKYLVDKGVDPGRLVAIGKGGALPWSSNQTEAGRAANRRVVFHIEGVSDEQQRRQVEIQKERALKRTGAKGDDVPAASPPGPGASKPGAAPPPPDAAPEIPKSAPAPRGDGGTPTDAGSPQKGDAGA